MTFQPFTATRNWHADVNSIKNSSDPIEQNEYEENQKSDFADANGDLSPTDIRKGKGQNWENINVESDEELLQFTRNKNFFELPNPGKTFGFSNFWECTVRTP